MSSIIFVWALAWSGPSSPHEAGANLGAMAARGDAAGIRAACRVHCDPNRNHGNALRQAVMRGSLEAASALVYYGADVNAADEDDWTPLLLAARDGNLGIVTLLVSHGAHVNHCNIDDTPLTLSVQGRYRDVARYLLEHGAGPNATCTDPTTALERARRLKDQDLVRLLEEHGALAEARESELFTVPGTLAGPVIVLLNPNKGANLPRRGTVRLYNVPPSGVLVVDELMLEESAERSWVSQDAQGRQQLLQPCPDQAALSRSKCISGFRTGRKGRMQYMAFWLGPSSQNLDRPSELDAAIARAIRTAGN